MLDIKAIRQNPEAFKTGIARKGADPSQIDALLAADEEKRSLQQQTEALKAEQNQASKSIPTLEGDEKAQALAAMKKLSEKRKTLEAELVNVQETFDVIMNTLPMPPVESAPDGKDDTENEVIEFVGEKPNFNFDPKEHWELAEALDILDTERSAKVSGSRFYYMKKELALLQRALIFWAYTETSRKFGFTPMIPPFMTCLLYTSPSPRD